MDGNTGQMIAVRSRALASQFRICGGLWGVHISLGRAWCEVFLSKASFDWQELEHYCVS
jgi:hypothetical protein